MGRGEGNSFAPSNTGLPIVYDEKRGEGRRGIILCFVEMTRKKSAISCEVAQQDVGSNGLVSRMTRV